MLPAVGRAQSLTMGTVTGTVLGVQGELLAETDVSLFDRASGLARTVLTSREGAFAFTLLPPGDYDLLVERLGFRPMRVVRVTVRPGGSVTLSLTLNAAPPPVTTIDTVDYLAGRAPGSRAALNLWSAPFELADLAGDRHDLANAAALATSSSLELGTEGLPGRFGGIAIDGLGHSSARHPGIAGGGLDGAAFPLSAFSVAELAAGTADVEWPGLGGGFVSAHSLRGTSHLIARAYGDRAGGASRGGVLVAGPIIRDTAAFAAGVDVRQLQSTLPALWTRDSLANEIDGIALDSSGVALDEYLRSHRPSGDVVTAFGRFDWQVAPMHALALRASVANITMHDLDLGPGLSVGLGSSLAATEISAGAALTSRLSPRLAQEVRFGVDASTRDYRAATLTGTTLVDAGIALGTASALPARIKRVTVRAGETLHLDRGLHQFKLGFGLELSSHDLTYASGRGGEFTFAGADEFRQRLGVFTQAVGSLPVAVFKTSEVAFFLQDRWTPAPGLDLVFGVRFGSERLPKDLPRRSTELFAATALDNSDFTRQHRALRPRFAFRWAAGPDEQWVVQGGAGIFDGEVDPGALGEVITHSGTVERRRGVGLLGSWPGVPDSNLAPVTGPDLSLLSTRLAPPRTGRVSLTVSKAMGARSALHLAGVYRHTDFLPRRADLNLLPGAIATDQYGRPIFGTLVQQGSLLAAAAGSNRRFADFDLVSALNDDGYSDYYGVTVALEHPSAGRFGFLASYTYSRTTDNWVGARGGGPDAQLSPFPDSSSGGDWSRGRSDFDVPHRVTAGLEWRVIPRIGFRLAVLFRSRSGSTFTPGFRDGVDANGDGSARNDPAFVTDTVAGFADLAGRWDCLRTQIQQFAKRNSCREGPVRNLDMRVGVALITVGSYHAELVVDALNLIRSETGIVDGALYLVDRSRAIDTASQPGRVVVPLVANPNFGRLLVRSAPDRVWRIGVRVTN